MVKKLKSDEKTFLLNKYMSMGCSKSEAENKLNKTLSLMVVSTLTMII